MDSTACLPYMAGQWVRGRAHEFGQNLRHGSMRNKSGSAHKQLGGHSLGFVTSHQNQKAYTCSAAAVPQTNMAPEKGPFRLLKGPLYRFHVCLSECIRYLQLPCFLAECIHYLQLSKPHVCRFQFHSSRLYRQPTKVLLVEGTGQACKASL